MNNDEVNKQLMEWARAGIDVASTEIPIFAEQILRWWTAQAFIGATVSLVILITALYFAFKKYKTVDGLMTGRILGGTVALLSGIVGICHLCDLVKCIVAPNVVLLEYVMRFSR